MWGCLFSFIFNEEKEPPPHQEFSGWDPDGGILRAFLYVYVPFFALELENNARVGKIEMSAQLSDHNIRVEFVFFTYS